jgi:hypothetical protein
VGLAEQACTRSARRNASYLDTLAAAHARAGDFPRAAAAAREALAIAPAARPEVEARLRLYEAGKPYDEAGSGIPATLHR